MIPVARNDVSRERKRKWKASREHEMGPKYLSFGVLYATKERHPRNEPRKARLLVDSQGSVLRLCLALQSALFSQPPLLPVTKAVRDANNDRSHGQSRRNPSRSLRAPLLFPHTTIGRTATATGSTSTTSPNSNNLPSSPPPQSDPQTLHREPTPRARSPHIFPDRLLPLTNNFLLTTSSPRLPRGQNRQQHPKPDGRGALVPLDANPNIPPPRE